VSDTFITLLLTPAAAFEPIDCPSQCSLAKNLAYEPLDSNASSEDVPFDTSYLGGRWETDGF
jgi:hypothetical protein